MLLLWTAVGDAYGAGFEFKPADFIRENNFAAGYFPHALSALGPGHYTDDTQMSIAIASIVVEEMEDVAKYSDVDYEKYRAFHIDTTMLYKHWGTHRVAQRFLDVFQADPRDTYSKRIYNALKDAKDGEGLFKLLQPTRAQSKGSGCAMRSLPLAVYEYDGHVVDRAIAHSTVTHDTAEALLSAMASGLIGHYYYWNKGPAHDVAEYVQSVMEHARMHVLNRPDWPAHYQTEEVKALEKLDWRKPWEGRVSSDGIPCVLAALTALKNTREPLQLLKECVNFGGDVDTVAAIAMGALSLQRAAWRWYEQLQPLVDGLENGTYGKVYLMGLSKALLSPSYPIWK
jgi:ADP-ribosyl-[dinitrogen reductase] hydrolase